MADNSDENDNENEERMMNNSINEDNDNENEEMMK